MWLPASLPIFSGSSTRVGALSSAWQNAGTYFAESRLVRTRTPPASRSGSRIAPGRSLPREAIGTGDPILELPPGSEHSAPWNAHPQFLARTPEPHALLYGAIDEGNYSNMVLLRGEDEPPKEVLEALEPWREVLRTRAEIARKPHREPGGKPRGRATALRSLHPR